MSWSGPAVGAAQYQQPPYTTAQPGYNPQQPYQYGQQASYNHYQAPPIFPPTGPPQRPPEIRPPKKKGNPIITRYPPPPGYRGPAQPQTPFGANQYQNQYQPGYSTPQSTFQHPSHPAPPPNYPPTPSYSPQSYNPQFPLQPNYAQPGYPPAQTYQQPGYQPNQPYSQPQNYQAGQGYGHNPYSGYPQQPTPVEPTQPQFSQAQAWSHPPSTAAPVPHDPYASHVYPASSPQSFSQDPNATPTPISALPITSQSTPNAPHPSNSGTEQNEKPQLFLAWDDWDFDFDGAIWPKSNEPVDPNLSLGVIIWRPAKQVTRALPSTFDEAEEQALKPPAEKLGNGESVSIYFTLENSHEAFLEVRQTDDWHKIKNDPIFVVFPMDKDMDLVPFAEGVALSNRLDNVGGNEEPEDAEMEDSSWNVMDNLEQALSGGAADAKSSNSGLPPSPSKETQSSQSQSQEDILAMLGVTGTPKPVSDDMVAVTTSFMEEKPPNKLPEKPPVPPAAQIIPQRPEQPQRAFSFGGHRTSSYVAPPQRPYGSMSSHPQPPPPPPPPDRAMSWNSRSSVNQPSSHAFGTSRASPAASEASNNTLAGSDFEAEKPVNEAEIASQLVPKLQRSDSSFSRKRSYDDGGEQNDEKLRQQDDHTRRKRRQPDVAPAYGRR